MRIDEFREIGRRSGLYIAVLEGLDDVVANVFLLVAFPFGQFEFFYVVYCLFCSHYLGQLEDLIDQIVPLQKWSLPKYLNRAAFTIPIMIIPADQQSTR